MDKLKMEARPMDSILGKVAQICPAAVQDNKIDFERLKLELAPELIEDAESYNFTWVGKKNAIMGASTPIRKTLRPCKEESKNWDTTKNLYIEGDNLDVLKLLQESYLGKVKMIYIDPPYNTGNDFVYCDDFADSCEEYMEKKGQCDVETNERLFKNDESNGRFHSNWCTMIYPRLKVARDLLSDDGVIFISIDDNEVINLKKICDEIFGESNFVTLFPRLTVKGGKTQTDLSTKNCDFVCCYAKNKDGLSFNKLGLGDDPAFKYSDKYEETRGKYHTKQALDTISLGYVPSLDYPIEHNGEIYYPGGTKEQNGFRWTWSKEKYEFALKNDFVEFKNGRVFPKKYLKASIEGDSKNGYYIKYEDKEKNYSQLTFLENEYSNTNGNNDLKDLDLSNTFSYPKPVNLLKTILTMVKSSEGIILDFFSGSATTAHAVMKLNAEDGGNRRFIMVQLPEKCPEGSKYANICEIGKERIRRAGDKIVAETGKSDLDIGFKVLKLDETNMKDVYYNPAETSQSGLLDSVDNIKSDRSDLDLLYGVMIDLGLQLDLDISEIKSGNTTYYNVDDGSLVACFAQNIPDSIIKEIAELKPLKVVFRDSSFADAPAKINVTEIFKTISPNTKITVL